MQNNSSITSFKRLMRYAKPWRCQVIRASIYSIVNKLFDIAPEILLGVAVDLVVRRENSVIASLGFESIQSQVAILAIATFFICVFE